MSDLKYLFMHAEWVMRLVSSQGAGCWEAEVGGYTFISIYHLCHLLSTVGPSLHKIIIIIVTTNAHDPDRIFLAGLLLLVHSESREFVSEECNFQLSSHKFMGARNTVPGPKHLPSYC